MSSKDNARFHIFEIEKQFSYLQGWTGNSTLRYETSRIKQQMYYRVLSDKTPISKFMLLASLETWLYGALWACKAYGRK